MKRKLQDAVVVVTGASSGIGRATALAFAKDGASVVLAARRESIFIQTADRSVRDGRPPKGVYDSFCPYRSAEAGNRRE